MAIGSPRIGDLFERVETQSLAQPEVSGPLITDTFERVPEPSAAPAFDLGQTVIAQKARDTGRKLASAAKVVDSHIGQFSFGFQRGLDDLGNLLGVVSDEELAERRKRLPEPQSPTEEAASLLGSFAPGPGLVTGPGKALVAGAKGIQAATSQALRSQLGGKVVSSLVSLSEDLKTPVTRVVKKLGQIGASLSSKGFNENVRRFVKESPELVFKPKSSILDVQRKAVESIRGQKRAIGEKVGQLKDEASKLGIDTFEINDIKEKLLTLKNKASAESGGREISRNIERFINVLETGNPEGKGLRAIRVKLEGMQNVLDTVVDNKKMQKIFGQLADGKSLVGSDRLLREAHGVLKNSFDEMLDGLDDKLLSRNLIDAKGEYSAFKRASRLIGGPGEVLNEKVLSKAVGDSMLFHHESEFEVLRQLLGDDLHRNLIGHVLSQPKDISASFLKLLGVTAAKTGGVLAGRPSDQLRKLPRSLIRGRQLASEATRIGELPTARLALGTLRGALSPTENVSQ